VRFVDRPHLAPHVCAVTLRGGTDASVKQWVETDVNLTGIDPHVYLSDVALREGARLIGWASPEDYQVAVERVGELEREVNDLSLQLAEADRHLTAIDTLESAGFRARKKTGRPPKEKA
jgi:hypothetical protein